MQPPVILPRPSHAVFHSADHVRLIAAYMQVNDLIQASALCRASHALFDSDVLWQDHLLRAGHVRLALADLSPLASVGPLAAQSTALFPLPSLSEAAALCLQTFIDRAEPAQPPPRTRFSCFSAPAAPSFRPAPRLTAIVRLPSTLCYHARIVQQRRRDPLQYAVSYVAFDLKVVHRGAEARWAAATVHSDNSGWAALNIDDNVGLQADDNTLYALPAAPAPDNHISCKQRYIEQLRCSESVHTHCHRLVGRVRAVYARREYHDRFPNIPPLVPLPVCTSCRTHIVRCVQRSCVRQSSSVHIAGSTPAITVLGVTRINQTLWEVNAERDELFTPFRVSIAHRERSASRTKQRREDRQDSVVAGKGEAEEVACYEVEVVARYGVETAVYELEKNVCERIQLGTTKGQRRCRRCKTCCGRYRERA